MVRGCRSKRDQRRDGQVTDDLFMWLHLNNGYGGDLERPPNSRVYVVQKPVLATRNVISFNQEESCSWGIFSHFQLLLAARGSLRWDHGAFLRVHEPNLTLLPQTTLNSRPASCAGSPWMISYESTAGEPRVRPITSMKQLKQNSSSLFKMWDDSWLHQVF